MGISYLIYGLSAGFGVDSDTSLFIVALLFSAFIEGALGVLLDGMPNRKTVKPNHPIVLFGAAGFLFGLNLYYAVVEQRSAAPTTNVIQILALAAGAIYAACARFALTPEANFRAMRNWSSARFFKRHHPDRGAGRASAP